VTRVYLPATLPLLAGLDRVGTLRVGDDVVLASDDSEDAEYDALMTAAETSAMLAHELEAGERRRVVVVAEVTALGETVALSEVVAVHADVVDLPAGAEPDDLEDLGWYATQEIPHLLLG
jgi:GTP-sensing pleiotropic transcriptional regulator CodY